MVWGVGISLSLDEAALWFAAGVWGGFFAVCNGCWHRLLPDQTCLPPTALGFLLHLCSTSPPTDPPSSHCFCHRDRVIATLWFAAPGLLASAIPACCSEASAPVQLATQRGTETGCSLWVLQWEPSPVYPLAQAAIAMRMLRSRHSTPCSHGGNHCTCPASPGPGSILCWLQESHWNRHLARAHQHSCWLWS